MTAGIVVVWEDGKPARRIVRGERDLPERSVVREDDLVFVYATDIERYERGERHWGFESVAKVIEVARTLAPTLKIHASLVEYALSVNTGNAYAAESAAREEVEKALVARATELRVDVAARTIKFVDVFVLDMGEPPPFPVPASYRVVSSLLHEGKRAETMIAAGPGGAFVVQADLGEVEKQPIGWFMAGFWGHGVNSYSVYYGRATERSRVFLRLPYGAGAYETDPKGARERALTMMRKYIGLADTLPCKHVTLIESQGFAHWRIERLDGTVAEMEHSRDDYFATLETFDLPAIASADATPCGLEIVWSASAPLHKLVRAPYVLGREQDAPNDERMSRRHLSIKPGSPHPYLEDLGSRNGSFVRGERVTAKSYPDGTIVRAARTVGVLVTDAHTLARPPHPAVALAKTIHDAAREHDAQIPVHATYVAWALEQTWSDHDDLVKVTRWALDEMDVLDEKLLRVREWLPRGRGAITRFPTLFERMMGEPPPFPVPDEYWVYHAYESPDGPIESLVGTRALKPMTIERDDGGIEARPVGWFLAGFWGRAKDDTSAVYYGRVTPRSRVYLRLRVSSMDPVDRTEAPPKALATMKKYIALAEALPCKHVLLQQAYDACHWRIERLDGSIAEMKQDKDTFPSYLDDYDLEAIARGR